MAQSEPSKSFLDKLHSWGTSSLPPTAQATLILGLHGRPPQYGPLLFLPVLLFGSYANLQGLEKDAAGITAAASGTYALLAVRQARRTSVGSLTGLGSERGRGAGRWKLRGAVRMGAIGLGIANAVACSWTYATVDRQKETEERERSTRWGDK